MTDMGSPILLIVGLIVYLYFRAQNDANPDNIYGRVNPALVCPHCQTRGHVRAKLIERKVDVSGANATGAILTGGLSLLAVGLSRKEKCTQAYCTSCGSTWVF